MKAWRRWTLTCAVLFAAGTGLWMLVQSPPSQLTARGDCVIDGTCIPELFYVFEGFDF